MQNASGYPAMRASRDNYLMGFVFALFCALVLVRFIINANVLDTVIKYSAEGGSIFEKIHPSSYGFVVILLIMLFSFRTELSEWDLRALRSFVTFVTAIGILSAFMWSSGRSGSAGYLIDSYVLACIAGALMLTFPPAWREMVGTTLIVFITISACIALGEFALHKRLLPYWATEASFRPTGLTEHPLMLGLFSATAVSFVPLTRWRAPTKIGATIVLLLGAFAAGARWASIGATASALAVLTFSEWPSVSRARLVQVKLLSLIAVALAIPVVLAVMIQLGMVTRFQEGLLDDSAMARVNIYGLFGLVSWNEILFGADIGRIRTLAFEHFDLEFIESSLVMFIFQFGLFGAVIFLLFLARTIFVLLSGASRYIVLGTGVFFIVASSNNALSSKTPIVLMIVLLIVAFHGRSSASARRGQ